MFFSEFFWFSQLNNFLFAVRKSFQIIFVVLIVLEEIFARISFPACCPSMKFLAFKKIYFCVRMKKLATSKFRWKFRDNENSTFQVIEILLYSLNLFLWIEIKIILSEKLFL